MENIPRLGTMKMDSNLFLALFLTLLLTGTAWVVDDNKGQAGEWETIFNGKDLTGWQIKIAEQDLGENYLNTFRVRDGKLIVAYDQYDQFDNRFGHIFYKEKLSYFKLRMDYRFTGEQVPGAPDWAYRNSGIKFHSQAPEVIPRDQTLLVAIEAQLLGGNGTDARPTGNVCTAGTHIEMEDRLITEHCINSTSPTFHGNQWVNVEIEVHGNELVIHRINGQEVLRYSRPQLDDSDPFSRQLIDAGIPRMLNDGYIALQAESHPVEFRNIQLMRLPHP